MSHGLGMTKSVIKLSSVRSAFLATALLLAPACNPTAIDAVRDGVVSADNWLSQYSPPPPAYGYGYGASPYGCVPGGRPTGMVDERALRRGGVVQVRPYFDPNAPSGRQVYLPGPGC